MQNFRALGAPPPHPRASGGWGLCPQTPSLRRLGASPPDPHWPPAAGGSAPRPPKQPPPLPISGYAPVYRPGTAGFIALRENIFWFFRQGNMRGFNNKVKNYGNLREFNKM